MEVEVDERVSGLESTQGMKAVHLLIADLPVSHLVRPKGLPLVPNS